MIWHLCTTEGKGLKDSFIAEMINAKVGSSFAREVNNIIRAKYDMGDDISEADKITIEEFNKDIQTGIQLYITLEDLYKKQFDDMDKVETLIKETSKGVVEHMLVKCGWVKEEAKCC